MGDVDVHDDPLENRINQVANEFARMYGIIPDRIDTLFPRLTPFIELKNDDSPFQPMHLSPEQLGPVFVHHRRDQVLQWVPNAGILDRSDYTGIPDRPPNDVEVVFIDTVDGLNDAIHTMEQHEIVYCHVEEEDIFSYRGITALLVFYIGGRQVFIVDTLALYEHLNCLNTIFMCEHIMKVFFDAESIVTTLQRDFSLYIVGLLDLKLGPAVLSADRTFEENIHQLSGGVMAMRWHLCDFCLRPLPPPLINFLALRVCALPSIMKLQFRHAGGNVFPVSLSQAIIHSRDMCLKMYVKPENTDRCTSSSPTAVQVLTHLVDLIGKREDITPDYLVKLPIIQDMAIDRSDTPAAFVSRYEQSDEIKKEVKKVSTHTGTCSHAERQTRSVDRGISNYKPTLRSPS